MRKYKNRKRTDAESREHKTARIDLRVTPKLKADLIAEARARNITETAYEMKLLEGRLPLPPMTDEQMAACNQISAARSDLIHFTNAMNGMSQEVRKQLFRSPKAMQMWFDGVNTLIRYLDKIIKMFLG